jgi:PucR C-terminal helix-turn-helix domain/GAF domain
MARAASRSRDTEKYRRRREHVLASLYATARSLTALGELDSVLSSIVKHAHELMGVELTYLSTVEGGELRLRAVEGAVSPRFRSARVRATIGIGGKVIQSRAPFWVRNYLEATDIEHAPAFDDLVVDEGLVALLGVPLLAQDRVHGVLYVADRVERPYSPDEVALLSAFADHASVALENARLYTESRTALAELQQAYVTIERSVQLHEALTRVVLTGGGEAKVAALLAQFLGGRVTIVSRHGDVVASRTDALETDPPGEPVWQDAMRESRSTGRSVTGRDGHGRWHAVAAITAGDIHLGAVLWSPRSEPTAPDLRSLERASHIVGLLVLKQGAIVHAEERVRGEVLTELIRSPLPLRPELVARGHTLRLHLDQFNALVVLGPCPARSREPQRRLNAVARDWAGLAGEHIGQPTLALRSDDLALTVRSIHQSLRVGLDRPVLVCGAPLDGHAGGFGRAFALAGRCAQVLALAGVDDVGTTTTENGMYAVLFDPDRAEDLQAFLDSTLGLLERYDEQRRADLISTLASYFANSRNAAGTARSMHVHINTLLKRLDRVGEILGPDWDSPDRALTLQLALRLRTLTKGMGQ